MQFSASGSFTLPAGLDFPFSVSLCSSGLSDEGMRLTQEQGGCRDTIKSKENSTKVMYAKGRTKMCL